VTSLLALSFSSNVSLVSDPGSSWVSCYYPPPKGGGGYRNSFRTSDIFVQSISQKVFEISTWNFIGGWISLRRSAVHKNDNSSLHIFWVIALCYFSKLIFVQSITQKAIEISTWNFIGAYISLRKCAVHKNDNSSLHNFWVFALCSFSYYLVRSLSQKVFEVSTWNFNMDRFYWGGVQHTRMITYPALFFSYCPLLFSAISIHIGFKSVITSAISFHYQKTS
jgi:hypothetical protein